MRFLKEVVQKLKFPNNSIYKKSCINCLWKFFYNVGGGTGYLLAKILIVRAEYLENDRNLRLIGWIAYLLGLPAWVILLVSRQNWIASAIETAGIPSIIFGIVMTWKQSNNPNKYIDWSIRAFTCIMILLGVIFSIYTFNGIKTFSQILEIIIIFGYLVSNYLLAKRNPFAWLMFMVGLYMRRLWHTFKGVESIKLTPAGFPRLNP